MTSLPLDTANDPLLTPGQVAQIFRVNPKTVARWALAGKLKSVRTPGGHNRYRTSEINRLMQITND